MSRSSSSQERSRCKSADRRPPSVAFERAPQSSSSQPSSASSSDDIRSFCDSISHIAGRLSRSLSIFGWQPTPLVSTQPHPMPTSSRYAGLVGLERSYVEAAEIPPTASGMSVYYDFERDVQEITFMGANQCLEKQTKRGARNPWRQYGALRKLHEIGGNAPEMMDKRHRKKAAGFVKIKRDSTPPPPPPTPEIVLNGTKDVALLRRLHIPAGVPADQLAQNIAGEMQRIGREMVGEPQQPSPGETVSGHSTGSHSRKTSHKSK